MDTSAGRSGRAALEVGVVLDAVPDVARASDALVSRVALQLAHRGAAGLPEALAALVDGLGARSAVLRDAGPGQGLIATAGEVVQSVSSRQADARAAELTVRAPDGSTTASLTVTGTHPRVLPLLRDLAAVLGLALGPVAPGHPGTSALADVEAARAHLAEALHDGPLQDLVVARYAADAAVRAGADPQVRAAVQVALVSLRRTLWQLHPRGADGLADALDRLSAQLVDCGAAPLRLRIDLDADVLAPPAALAAYRLVQAVVPAPSAAGQVTVRLVRQDAPGGREVLALSVDGGAPLAEPARWRRTAAALGGDLLCCPARLRLTVPVAPTGGRPASSRSAAAGPAGSRPGASRPAALTVPPFPARVPGTAPRPGADRPRSVASTSAPTPKAVP